MVNKEDGDRLLASDVERDEVVNRLSDAYASGRLTAAEFEHRSGKALSARTHGELDDVLRGLGQLDRQKPRSGRQVAFWVLAVPLSAIVLFGVVLVAFVAESDDRFGGLVLLAAFVPVLLGATPLGLATKFLTPARVPCSSPPGANQFEGEGCRLHRLQRLSLA